MEKSVTVPDELHRKIKIMAFQKGKSIQKFVFDILSQSISRAKNANGEQV